MVKVKFFENSSLTFLERRVNEFLEGIDEETVMNVNITTSQRDNVSPSSNYIAVVVFREYTETSD